MKKSARIFGMLVVSVWTILMAGAAFGADALKGEKKQAITQAKQNINALKQEKVAALHALKDKLKIDQAELRKLFKEGKITKDQYKAQLKTHHQMMQTALSSARAEFQAALGLAGKDLKDLKVALKGVSNSDQITAALGEYNNHFNSVVNELNGNLKSVASEIGISFNDIVVSIS